MGAWVLLNVSDMTVNPNNRPAHQLAVVSYIQTDGSFDVSPVCAGTETCFGPVHSPSHSAHDVSFQRDSEYRRFPIQQDVS